MTLSSDFQAVGHKLETKWIDEAWPPSRQLIIDWRVRIREKMLSGFSQAQFQRFQRPGVLTPDEQRRLASVISGSLTFRRTIPRMIGEMSDELIRAYYEATEAVYKQCADGIAEAYNKNTPEAVQFTAQYGRSELAALKAIRYEGIQIPAAYRLLTRDMGKQIAAQVGKHISDSGNSATAQRALLDRVSGMFGGLENKVYMTFRQYLLSCYKSAESDCAKLVKA